MGSPCQENLPTKDRKESAAFWRRKRLGIICFALVCTMFIGALDNSMVGIALPTIVADLRGGDSYTWVGNAYSLAVGAFSPLYGKLSNMFGRKTILYSCIAIFLIGCALCGAAQNMTWLIVCRAIQGIGGGGVTQLSVIIMSDLVPLRVRGYYGGLLVATSVAASVVGPLLGGALVHHASWRWCFFIVLPIGCVTVTLLLVFLDIHPGKDQKRTLRDHISNFDFIGLVTLVTGVVSLLVGLNFGERGWSEPRTISLLVVGVALLVTGGINEAFTKRAAILPSRLFEIRTSGCLLATAFLHDAAFSPATIYLPLFYQVLGSSPMGAGVRMLPFPVVASTFVLISGLVVSRTGKCRPAIWFGSTLFVVGTGLMTMLDYTSSIAEQEILPMVKSTGSGFLIQISLVALQATVPQEDMAPATTAYLFLRTLGDSVGLAVGQAIVAAILPKKLAGIPNISSLGFGDDIASLIENIKEVHLIPDITLRDAVLQAWCSSIAMVWTVSTGLAGLSLFLTLFLREYSLHRETERSLSGDIKDAEDGKKNSATVEELEVVH